MKPTDHSGRIPPRDFWRPRKTFAHPFSDDERRYLQWAIRTEFVVGIALVGGAPDGCLLLVQSKAGSTLTMHWNNPAVVEEAI